MNDNISVGMEMKLRRVNVWRARPEYFILPSGVNMATYSVTQGGAPERVPMLRVFACKRWSPEQLLMETFFLN